MYFVRKEFCSKVLFVFHASIFFPALPLCNTSIMTEKQCSLCATATVEQEMKKDWLFAPHYRYYVREMRIQAYSQLLESYRSLTLGYMAEAFGVSTEFIDQ